jgi:predicted transcriptional regulator
MGQQSNGYLRRLSMSLPESLVIDVQELALKMRRSGHRVSFSAFVEVALREMVARDNIVAVMRKYGAGARRHLEGNGSTKAEGNGSIKTPIART